MVETDVIFYPLLVLEKAVLRTDAGIIESGRYGMDICHLSELVLQEVADCAVEYAWSSLCQCGGMASHLKRGASSLYANELHRLVVHEAPENTHGIAAAAHTGHNIIRECFCLFENLGPRLLPDD